MCNLSILATFLRKVQEKVIALQAGCYLTGFHICFEKCLEHRTIIPCLEDLKKMK